MKKALSLVLAALLLTALLAVGVMAGDPQEGVAVYGTPTVDGKIDEWANVPAYTVDRLKTGVATTITAQFRVMWDESHLYTLVEVKDPDHSFNGGPSVGDGCEVYIDLNNEKSGSFEMDTQAYVAVCANDAGYLSFDGSAAGKSYLEWGTVCAIEETADGYNYEFVMDTATDFEVALSEGKVIGFDIQINDQNENADSRTGAYGWCDDTDAAWQSPASYGTITLTKDGAAAPAAAASGAEPTMLWDFGADEDMSSNMGANSNANVMYYGEEDYYVFMATANDPYVSVDIPVDAVEDIWWAKIRVKNPSPATAVELFGATSGRSLSGPECTHFEIEPNCDEWRTYVIYIPDENVKTANAYKGATLDTTYWEGNVDWIRLDPMWHEGDDGSDNGGSCESGDEIHIDYIAFFKTEADAKAFRADQDTAAGAAAPAADAAAETPAEAAPAAEGYPSSGFTPKDGSAIITGEIIGLELGWDGTAACGRTAAFDGDPKTFFDPLGTGDGWAGIDAGSEYTLTSILIHPRTDWLDRFSGGTIEGSMDPEFENAVEIWSSVEAAPALEWQIIDQSDFDEVGSFRYYRYINYTNHGDVGDIELYGYPSDGEYEAQEAARQEAAAKAAEEAAAKKAEAEAAKAAEAEAKAAEEAAKAAEEAAAAEAAAAEAGEAVEAAADTAAAEVEEAKGGCGSFIGGGLIVLVTILGCGWMTSRKH